MLPSYPNDRSLVEEMMRDPELGELRLRVLALMGKYKYAYNFTWWDRPIIQLPQDVMAMQMLIMAVQPDVIVETGIAHGGSLIFNASMLELLGGDRQVVGVDIDIRPHNRAALEAHPMAKRITLIEGSSTDPRVVEKVHALAGGGKKVLVSLDSNHTHEHVAAEIEAYSSLVTKGSYLVVFDTAIDEFPANEFPGRPWGPGNNPKTAVREFLRNNDRFQIDHELEARLLFTVSSDGYLKCVK